MIYKAFNFGLILAVFAVSLFGMVGNANADGVYRTERIELEPVNGAPLVSGVVVNIHANGPNIYATEVYELNGAAPYTDYQVVLLGYLGSLNCEGAADLAIPTSVVSTNIHGNGRAKAVFTPEAVAGLNGFTVGVKWQVWDGPTLAYQTSCTEVTLD